MQPSFAIVGGFAAGKTTLANEFVDRGWTRVSLAGRLKEMAATVFGGGRPIGKNESYAVVSEDGSTRLISGRQVLQELGQSVKALDRDFWLRWLTNDILDGRYGDAPYVCDDCRFPYEAEALKRIGFTIVRVYTPETVRRERYASLYGRPPTEEELNHPSETQVALIKPDLFVSGTDDVSYIADFLLEKAAA